jgi:hypothetical protein
MRRRGEGEGRRSGGGRFGDRVEEGGRGAHTRFLLWRGDGHDTRFSISPPLISSHLVFSPYYRMHTHIHTNTGRTGQDRTGYGQDDLAHAAYTYYTIENEDDLAFSGRCTVLVLGLGYYLFMLFIVIITRSLKMDSS